MIAMCNLSTLLLRNDEAVRTLIEAHKIYTVLACICITTLTYMYNDMKHWKKEEMYADKKYGVKTIPLGNQF